jgi:hypothetical protein
MTFRGGRFRFGGVEETLEDGEAAEVSEGGRLIVKIAEGDAMMDQRVNCSDEQASGDSCVDSLVYR